VRGGPGLALARSCVEGELNQGKAALQLERHDEAAARWSTLAADKGHGGASCNLARMYAAGGPGLPADRAQAEKWGKVAVARGFPDPLRAHAEPARRAPEALAVSKEGERALYRQSAALGNHKAGEAPITFDRFSWPTRSRRTSTPPRRNSTPWHSIS
jgi:hypothetical protein